MPCNSVLLDLIEQRYRKGLRLKKAKIILSEYWHDQSIVILVTVFGFFWLIFINYIDSDSSFIEKLIGALIFAVVYLLVQLVVKFIKSGKK